MKRSLIYFFIFLFAGFVFSLSSPFPVFSQSSYCVLEGGGVCP